MGETRLSVIAVACAARGLFVFPLLSKRKIPPKDTAGHLGATNDVETVRAWWTADPDQNIGLHPGRSGVVVIDSDGLRGEEAAAALDLCDCDTLCVQTGRPDGGRHRYFLRPDFEVGNRSLARGLDVRCDHGYVVLPPSVHPSGAIYRWIGRWQDLRPLPARALEALRAAQQSDDPPQAPAAAPPTAVESASLDRRIEAYIDRVGHVGQGQRNASAFQLAAWLVRDMALDSHRAWAWLSSWNAANLPPLGTKELRACLKSALTHGRRSRGAGLERVRRAPNDTWQQRFERALASRAR